jgi:prolactin regulatory element-binding protein
MYFYVAFQVAKLGLGSQLPYRMVVHPGGDGVICAFPSSCRYSNSF